MKLWHVIIAAVPVSALAQPAPAPQPMTANPPSVEAVQAQLAEEDGILVQLEDLKMRRRAAGIPLNDLDGVTLNILAAKARSTAWLKEAQDAATKQK